MKTAFITLMISLIFSCITLAKPLPGIADLHLHLLFHLSSGGTVDMQSVELPKEAHYIPCGDKKKSSFFRKFAFRHMKSVAALFLKRPCHDPKILQPNSNTIGAQQAWIDSLKLAHQKGLTLAVVSIVNSRALCQNHKKSKRKFPECDDTSSIVRQLDFFHKLNKKHDWMELALSATQASEIVKKGKLAIILSIEASDLFDQKDWRKQADYYYERGIRSFQIVHMFDNRFSGAAIYRNSVKLAFRLDNYKKTGKYTGFKTYIDKEVNPYITKRRHILRVIKNKKGLTQQGRELIMYMAKKGYLIDLAHASERSLEEAAQILSKFNYPFYISHGHPREIINDKMGRFEKATNPRGFELLRKAKGIFGLRTFYEKAYTFTESGVKNNCDGSSKSLAQALSYIEKKQKVPVILASDLNGMIQQTKPRYDRKDCPHESAKDQLKSTFDYTGLGSVDQLTDLVDDLEKVKADTHGLRHSTHEFVEFWLRNTPVNRMPFEF